MNLIILNDAFFHALHQTQSCLVQPVSGDKHCEKGGDIETETENLVNDIQIHHNISSASSSSFLGHFPINPKPSHHVPFKTRTK